MTDFEKIKAFIDKKGVTVTDFARKIEVSSNYLPYIRKFQGSINFNTLSKISESFPDFDVVGFVVSGSVEEWLRCISDPPPAVLDKNQITERLLTFLKELEVSDLKLKEKTGLGRNFMGSLQQQKTGYTTATLRKILAGFAQLNPHWLILGKGKMLIPPKAESKVKQDLQQQITDLSGVLIEQEQAKLQLLTDFFKLTKGKKFSMLEAKHLQEQIADKDKQIQSSKLKIQQILDSYYYNALEN